MCAKVDAGGQDALQSDGRRQQAAAAMGPKSSRMIRIGDAGAGVGQLKECAVSRRGWLMATANRKRAARECGEGGSGRAQWQVLCKREGDGVGRVRSVCVCEYGDSLWWDLA